MKFCKQCRLLITDKRFLDLKLKNGKVVYLHFRDYQDCTKKFLVNLLEGANEPSRKDAILEKDAQAQA
jgi:hypothetical protein